MLPRALARNTIPHVCVIGAGTAGLRCADVLLQHGVKVTILEGRNRVGGRLCQSLINGRLVDLGPNWIHGTDGNPIMELAEATGTVLHSWGERQAMFDPSGKNISDEESALLSGLVWSIIADAFQYSNDDGSSISENKSLLDFFREQLNEKFSADGSRADDSERLRECVLNVAEMWNMFVGSHISLQSLKFFWLEECIEGENPFVAETYHKILNRIAEPALAKAKVKFDNKVTKIRSIHPEDPKKMMVEVTTSSGEVSEFDEVVCTTPLGWLKQNTSAFEPALPSRLVEAIQSIGYGNLDKTYITFPTAFWDVPPESGGDGATLNSAKQQHQSAPNTIATTAPLHQNSDAQSQDSPHFPGFIHWMSPNYAEDTNPKHWNQEGINLAALPDPLSQPTLLYYTYGEISKHIASLVRDSEKADPTPTLTSFFKPYFSLLPNYNADSPMCTPISTLFTNWCSDDLAGNGSYCNFRVGSVAADKDIETMREGMPDRGIWLAGEHTSPFIALGTVTGAYWSGENVARRVLSAWGISAGKDPSQE
ncbi:hypothetical protein BDY21DRAFT_8963 [Lineolata rhizophorae]|uniref:Amine oxidase domain-containing protein n=1 Tax=Lineolata rhizophorae TaxID=578093 RepID=A0A6A6PDY5_9PEZI|nr:hypothetical protein BDY21DRAFT_8963 [Lineolata rhizophorae]